MKWRPTLAAVAVLAAVAALTVAMSSGSAPAASASLDDTSAEAVTDPPPAQPIAAELPERPDPLGAADDEDPAEAAGDEGERTPEQEPAAPDAYGDGDAEDEDEDEAPWPAAAAEPARPDEDPAFYLGLQVDGQSGPALAGAAGNVCPDSSDLLVALYRAGETCYWQQYGEQPQDSSSADELALLESVPFVAGHTAEPLGRPARTIRMGPRGEPEAPRFYLTFDDGPNARWTPPTLDLLDRYGARATFFPAGVHAAGNMALVEEIVARGHTIGSHLWSHERAALTSEELFRRELRASADLYGELGTNCLRPPFGVVSDDILRWAGDEGFEVVLWAEPDPRDWELPGFDALVASMLSVQNGSILILHEHTGATTLAALDAALAALQAQGWQFDEPICPLRF
ncbi:MAG: polysaccharide deacetylase family protein [Acidimicrobiia bacterium]|nr:polysaccharide deacetylase family protein [Acidimicrobiia bacterium]MYE67017.1 polysaccharide deacetylase family protein [Acidimicrobiia bacterium]MYJ12935.1 polysaccharide deacetylase family protein [Acidimicrobiia bacterium]